MYEFKSEDGKIYGPYEEEQILELVNCARMDGNSLVRKKTNEEWTSLTQIEELSHSNYDFGWRDYVFIHMHRPCTRHNVIMDHIGLFTSARNNGYYQGYKNVKFRSIRRLYICKNDCHNANRQHRQLRYN